MRSTSDQNESFRPDQLSHESKIIKNLLNTDKKFFYFVLTMKSTTVCEPQLYDLCDALL